ncbi:hypothetical protein NUW54_g10020 [Trametes sanguinea]|uniref:Uncharacterized protein n=1 Tax=Trametes sanguinea TaxID=158606 RepID=A0ACC1P527_9APHY|nr:hypothetical protein NUW54_g10020 [Trametes sanguinea]
MRLPRRVPWQDLSELEQLCGWIYADENDLDATRRAVHRLAAWKASVPLPHALESAHAILSVILQDGNSATSSSYLSLRMSYASALIRLVNGLVDPLQLGAYARSINSIAQQLGLPAWFVELRHAATHEDLPSLEVLRDAAREAMGWLLHKYFMPTLNPSTPSGAPAQPLRPLEPLLKQYKLVAFSHVDTSTGVLSDAKAIAEVVRRVSPNTLVALDGVCSVASEEIQMDAWGIDVVLTASQKGLGVPPGLSIVVASQKAMKVEVTHISTVHHAHRVCA